MKRQIDEFDKNYINIESLNKDINNYKELFSSNSILAFINENNIIVETNKYFCDFFQVNVNDIIGRRIEDIFIDEEKRQISKTLETTRKNKTQSNITTTCLKNPESPKVFWNFDVVYNDNNSNEYIICLGKVVSDQFLIDYIIDKDKFFIEFISHITEAVIIADDEDNIIVANNKAIKMFLISENIAVDKLILSNLFDEKYLKEIKNTNNIYYPLDIKLPQGKTLNAEVKFSKIKILDTQYNLYMFRDLFYKKFAQEEIIKMLEKTQTEEKIKNKFIANMSHEIKTPLNGIIGFLDIMNQTELSDAQKEYLNIVSRSANNLNIILNRILEFFKLQSGMVAINISEFNIYEEFESIIDDYKEKAQEKNISLYLNIDTDIPDVLKGDIQKLKVIISELLLNAIKFTNENGSVCVAVSIKEHDANQCKLRFSVTDTGIGMDDEIKSKIFNPFYQQSTENKEKDFGCGLGLPVCKDLINLIGGKLNVFSNADNGSEFYFISDFFVESTHIFYRPYFKKKVVAIPFYERDNFKHFIKNYLVSLGCKCLEYKNINELNANDLWIIYSEYNKENIDYLIENHKNIIKIISMPSNINDENMLLIDNLIKIETPVTYKKIEKTLSAIYNNKTKFSSIDKSYYGKVLITDDNEVNRKLVRTFLEKHNIEIDEAENGQVAYQLATKNRYDIIFMDIDMPILDGIEATSLIHEKERNSNLKESVIVALTAGALHKDEATYLSYGMKGYLQKPLEKEKLEFILKKYLKRK